MQEKSFNYLIDLYFSLWYTLKSQTGGMMNILDYVKKEGTSIPKFAKLVGYSAQHLYDVIYKKCKPSKRFMKTIEETTKGEVKEIDFIEIEEIKKDLDDSIQKITEEGEIHG